MRETLEKVITNNDNGLFLLDPPMGFGKTTVVVDLIRRFLDGEPLFSNVKRIFFVTNLITNLPCQDLLNSLDEEHRKLCFQAKATIDYVLENFFKVNITEAEVKNSKEYKTLKKGLCSIGRTKTKSGCAETDKSKLSRKRVIELPEKVAAKRFKTE